MCRVLGKEFATIERTVRTLGCTDGTVFCVADGDKTAECPGFELRSLHHVAMQDQQQQHRRDASDHQEHHANNVVEMNALGPSLPVPLRPHWQTTEPTWVGPGPRVVS